MASVISTANGAFTAAATWAYAHGTATLDSEADNTAVPATSFGTSQTFILGATYNINGIAVKLASLSTSPSGTIYVDLYNVTDGSIAGGTTINVSDLPACDTTNNEGGWVLFKIPTVTPIAGKSYAVRARTRTASMVNLYRNATAVNWSRMLRTDTTGAPSTGSILHIMGEYTAAGSAVMYSVSMDNTATTDFGSGTDASTALTVNSYGSIGYNYAAATQYYLKLSGNAIVYSGGKLNIGTTANPIPSGGTAVLEFDPVADSGMGLYVRNLGSLTMQGSPYTAGKTSVSCKLNTNFSTGSVWYVDTDTGWYAGGSIAVASTTRTYSQCEGFDLRANASTGSLWTSAASTTAHSGSAPTQAEVIWVTRNVKLRGMPTVMALIQYRETSTVDIDWVEFSYLDSIFAYATTGSFNMQYSVLRDFEDYGLSLASSAGNNKTVSNNVFWNVANVNGLGNIPFSFATTTGTNNIISDNIFMYCGGSGASYQRGAISIGDVGSTFTNNTIVGTMGIGPALELGDPGSVTANISNNTIHSCNGSGLSFSSVQLLDATSCTGTISSMKIWRNNSYGIFIGRTTLATASYSMAISGLVLKDLYMFGNTTSNIYIQQSSTDAAHSSSSVGLLTLEGGTIIGDTAYTTTNGLYVYGTTGLIKCFNCSFGTSNLALTSPHTYDINIGGVNRFARIELYNSILGSTTEVYNNAGLETVGYIKSSKHDQTAGKYKSWFRYGYIESDGTIYNTTTPSMRFIPNSASYKLESGSFKVNVNNGQLCTPSVYVRESVVGDGTDYNGNRIRLIAKRNDSVGITADTVIDTATVASEGSWEELTGSTVQSNGTGVMEFVLDCDGNTGWANVDDFSATVA